MAKEKSIHAYELEIRKMIEKRVGTFEIWLKPQVEATAMNRAMLNKVHNELIKTDTDLMLISPGSQGQMKQEAHPLLSHYKELQRTLILQYEALTKKTQWQTITKTVSNDTGRESKSLRPACQ